MTSVLVTGAADGLGLETARQLVAAGHRVVLHARSPERAAEALAAAPGAVGTLAADLSSLAETRDLAEQADAAGPFDAVVHNAGVGFREARSLTPDGVEHVLAINVLAPYVLTALMERPRSLVFLSSGMHRSGSTNLSDLAWEDRPWNGSQAYSDSKLFDAVLAFAVARRWPGVRSNAVEPGWVATRMGGPGAPDDLHLGGDTQAWLAAGDDPASRVTGRYLFHREPRRTHPAVSARGFQDALLTACEALTGVALPD